MGSKLEAVNWRRVGMRSPAASVWLSWTRKLGAKVPLAERWDDATERSPPLF